MGWSISSKWITYTSTRVDGDPVVTGWRDVFGDAHQRRHFLWWVTDRFENTPRGREIAAIRRPPSGWQERAIRKENQLIAKRLRRNARKATTL